MILREVATAFLLLFGSVFMLLAALGVFRMPDLLTRMQTASKASTLGVVSMLLGVAVHFWELRVAALAILVICSVFLTTPVAAHMLARSVYLLGLPVWRGPGKARPPGGASGPR